jgi:hypothetical protein
MQQIDTLVILDGGSKDNTGFYAGYEKVCGIESIAYSMKCGIDSRYIGRIYVYSDDESRVMDIASRNFSGSLVVLDRFERFPDAPEKKVLRVVPAEQKLAMSLQRTFYQYIVNDRPGMQKFYGDWKNFDHIRAYHTLEPSVRDLSFFAIPNDVVLNSAYDLDDMLSKYDPLACDVMWGHTKKSVVDSFLEEAGLQVSDFHKTLQKNDFINGVRMRHNGLWIVKWGGFDRRTLDFITYCNQHRYQSKPINLLKVFGKFASSYLRPDASLANALGLGFLYVAGKYCEDIGKSSLCSLIARKVTGGNIARISCDLLGVRILIYDKCSARPVLDMDSASDVPLMEKLLLMKKV